MYVINIYLINHFYHIQGTGSNGNAGPVSGGCGNGGSGGVPIDPAAETFKKQQVNKLILSLLQILCLLHYYNIT